MYEILIISESTADLPTSETFIKMLIDTQRSKLTDKTNSPDELYCSDKLQFKLYNEIKNNGVK